MSQKIHTKIGLIEFSDKTIENRHLENHRWRCRKCNKINFGTCLPQKYGTKFIFNSVQNHCVDQINFTIFIHIRKFFNIRSIIAYNTSIFSQPPWKLDKSSAKKSDSIA